MVRRERSVRHFWAERKDRIVFSSVLLTKLERTERPGMEGLVARHLGGGVGGLG